MSKIICKLATAIHSQDLVMVIMPLHWLKREEHSSVRKKTTTSWNAATQKSIS
jgi:hypothetical protein